MPTRHYRHSDRYWFVWLSFASAIGIIASLAFRDLRTASMVFFAVVIAILGFLGALPWVFRTAEAWRCIVRLRWIVIGFAALTSFLLIGRRHGLYIFAALALLWLMIVNLLIFALRRFTKGIPLSAEAMLYFLGDLWLIVMLSYLGLGWYYIGSLLAASALLVMLYARLPRWLFAIFLAIYGIFLPLVLPGRAITFAVYLALIVTGVAALTHDLSVRLCRELNAGASSD